ncbi:hypothetical protein GJ744_003809 [Endocarpon pusillum]|uniref:Uncharacterized protein n=1 Tax=Endocarpon pusillum TaxID=364733 RepID=A0A8H7E9E8_9EURO|nr:hypothetical protein GJ744_003809 [Endocarpon pusillum]
MHLDIPNIIWVYSCAIQDLAEDVPLNSHERAGYRLCLCGVICITAQNNRLDWVFIGNSIFKPLENDGGDSLTSAVPIGVIIERFAVPNARQGMTSVEPSSKVLVVNTLVPPATAYRFRHAREHCMQHG